MGHATRADTTPDPGAEGSGYWSVVCLGCGWETEGRYAPGREPEGLAMANLRGDLHEANEKLREAMGRG